MAIAHSPLRYPGGKQVLARLVAHLVRLNGATGGTYIEPYAGGAGVALALLFGEHVDRVLINDADPYIYAFWKAVLFETDRFIELLHTTPATVTEWVRQRAIYKHPKRYGGLRVGFATFYLNRCNRSGIIADGGPIGGHRQTGKWKIDARLNRVELERRIRKIAMYRERIAISNDDAIQFIDRAVIPLDHKRTFVYLDPPYYAKGCDLYLNYYSPADHAALARYITKQRRVPWVMSYDHVPEIAMLYAKFRQVRFALDYTARERREGNEVLIFRHEVAFPRAWKHSIPRRFITSADDAPAFPSV